MRERHRNIAEKRGGRVNALEHPLLKGFSTGQPTGEGALTRTELLLLLQLQRAMATSCGCTEYDTPKTTTPGSR